MATNQVVGGIPYVPVSRTAWGAIFGGTFVYVAIMSTFGLTLAAAIFASSGWTSLGFIIWNSVVAIISLYFAGRASARLASAGDRNVGLYHGLITFGMCFFTTVLVIAMVILSAAPFSSAASANTRVGGDVLSLASGGGWSIWCAMFLGFIAAGIGGAHAAPKPLAPVVNSDRDIRRVA